MKKIYIVTLTIEERLSLEKLVRSGTSSARKLTRARILLKADESTGAGLVDSAIAEALDVGLSTVERTRIALVEESLEIALNGVTRRQRPPVKIDGKVEAHIARLACSTPPEGRSAWTLKLLADGIVEAEILDSISTEAVRLVLKKTNLSLGEKNSGAFRRTNRALSL
jgi:transposase